MLLQKNYAIEILDTGRTAGPTAKLCIFYGITGVCQLQVDRKTVPLEKNAVFLLPPGKTVRLDLEGGALAAIISLDCIGLRELSPKIQHSFSMSSRDSDGEWYGELQRRVQGLLLAFTGGGRAQTFRELGEYYLLLHLLFQRFQTGDTSGSSDTDRASQLMAMLWESDRATLSLQELASRLYLSTAAASRLFRSVTGESFSSYKKRARMEQVERELKQGEKPITTIAVEAGFSSASVFNRTFKESFGVTPSQYRKEMKDNRPAEPWNEKIFLRVFEILEQEQSARRAGRLHRVTASVSETIPCGRWKNRILNVGTAHLLQNAAVQRQVSFLAERLDIEYVRLWSLFSPQMLLWDGTERHFNFSFLDAVLDFCVDSRLKLHLDLAQRKDFSLASERSEIYSHSTQEEVEWFPLAEAFLQHIRRRYTEEAVSQWVFELTFYLNDQPYSSQLSDLEVWKQGYTLIKSVLPGARVAGPGLICSSAKRDMRKVIERYAASEFPPDIFTTVNYPYDFEGTLEEESIFQKQKQKVDDRDFLAQQAGFVRQTLRELGFAGEYWVTDWGFSLANRNYMQDSCFRGAAVLRQLLNAQGAAEAFGVFCATDLLSAYGDVGSVLTGSAGLLSQGGVHKPVYYAYRFLGTLGRRQLCRTEHCIITAEGERDIRIICFNTKALGHQYYLLEENAHRPDQLDGLFVDLEPLEIELVLAGFREDQGPYCIRQRILNEAQGGPLGKWVALGCSSNLSRGDMEFLERTSIPAVTLEQREAPGGQLCLRFRMEPNELRSITIN